MLAKRKKEKKKTCNIAGQQATTESDEGSELNTEHHAPQNTRQRDRQTGGIMWVIAGAGLKGGEGDEGVITSGSGDEIEAPVKWAKVLTFRTKADAMTSRYLTNTASQKGRIARYSLEGRGGGGGWGRLFVVVGFRRSFY